MDRNNDFKKETIPPKKVFLPRARTLSGEEIESLSDKEKTVAQNCKDKGVWLELFCPDDSCLREEERINQVGSCGNSEKKPDLWLKVFCHDGSCEISQNTQLP